MTHRRDNRLFENCSQHTSLQRARDNQAHRRLPFLYERWKQTAEHYRGPSDPHHIQAPLLGHRMGLCARLYLGIRAAIPSVAGKSNANAEFITAAIHGEGRG